MMMMLINVKYGCRNVKEGTIFFTENDDDDAYKYENGCRNVMERYSLQK